MTDRRDGLVLITLITVSTIVMLTVMGVCCVIRHRHDNQHIKRDKHAEVQMMKREQTDARVHAFLA